LTSRTAARYNGSRMRPTTRWPLAAIGVASVVLALNGRLIAGAVGPKWDADGFFAPFFTLVADHARAGRSRSPCRKAPR
jgi:hypothetical protein